MQQLYEKAEEFLGRGHGVTLTVFMEGTSNAIDTITTQIGLFSRLCDAEALPVDGSGLADAAGHYKLGFPGCGVSHGTLGTLFAVGLREQCGVVRSYLERFLQKGHSVKVNFVGFSRGGIGGLYLANELMTLKPEPGRVTLSMLLFDPVPGNSVWLARFDMAGAMNANRAMDVSTCSILDHVVALYPCEPLESWTMHAPLIATFPPTCRVEQDVVLGCHQRALWLSPAPDSCLAFSRIRDFLEQSGSRVRRSSDAVAKSLDISEAELAGMLDRELALSAPSTRAVHSSNSGHTIERREAGVYLNRWHEQLSKRLGEASREAAPGCYYYMLDISVSTRHC
mmetsp:Transcript_118957/g.333180  ORF Transcript_118957/g.333180 Transcript_118957/m.333180 type:complete len:339 (-) Transcript_118957:210-1226(-)|eukprot:CAMPEP_0176234186 /NCGR_PEP_ID=MMETSP0121_2-20121125/26206_1 /TAXON_ID=160619 /ORGANISM="Kryptoperidinium foliaceum, Strain CCMP 1326" /LENGTH=338 /DNA_ID=CAMNT_0017573595 /DNA_START=86 /DNA_END=1102 /DNA_ORIENTATION=-